jgi:ribosomal protein S27AE
MNDEILKRLEARLDRRSFLRGSGLTAAALLGVAAASPLVAFAQVQDKPQADKAEHKKDEPEKKDEQNGKEKSTAEDEDPTKVTKLDAEGNEYRQCPECGSNMYRQGRTWTCENCGYSYVE